MQVSMLKQFKDVEVLFVSRDYHYYGCARVPQESISGIDLSHYSHSLKCRDCYTITLKGTQKESFIFSYRARETTLDKEREIYLTPFHLTSLRGYDPREGSALHNAVLEYIQTGRVKPETKKSFGLGFGFKCRYKFRRTRFYL